jgi:hypothetical protein
MTRFMNRHTPAQVVCHDHSICTKCVFDISPCQVALAPTSLLSRFSDDALNVRAGSTDC